MRKSTQLIEQVIEAGRKRGLLAADIAVKAGILPANLSRVRKTGKYNADTLERLLAAVDGETRVTVGARKPGQTLPMVCKKLNAGRRRKLTQEALRRLLTRFRSSQRANDAFSHLVGVMEELPLEQVHDLVIEGDATLPSLKRVAEFTQAEGTTAEWIDEQISSAN
jgi:hypothetical protein